MKGTLSAPDTRESLGAMSGVVTYYGGSGGELNNADNCLEDLALLVCSDTYNPELRVLLSDTFAYVMTWQYHKGDAASNRCQMAIGYRTPKMAIRVYIGGTWTPWTLLATASA